MSPNYCSFGSLISLLARRKAKSVFMLQAQTPARYLFFNTIQNTNFHSNFPPMLSPNTCHYSAGQLRGWPEPVTSAALQETKGTAHPTVASSWDYRGYKENQTNIQFSVLSETWSLERHVMFNNMPQEALQSPSEAQLSPAATAFIGWKISLWDARSVTALPVLPSSFRRVFLRLCVWP